jgi:hypothetical protein
MSDTSPRLVAFPPVVFRRCRASSGRNGAETGRTGDANAAIPREYMERHDNRVRNGVGGSSAAGCGQYLFPSRSLFGGGTTASRTCVAVAPCALLISRHIASGQPARLAGLRRGLCRERVRRVNGMLIMFPLACPIGIEGRFGRQCDVQTRVSDRRGLIAGPWTPARQAESTGAME